MVAVVMAVVGICARIFACMVVGAVVEGCFTPQPARLPLPAIPASGRSITGIASWYGPGFNGRRTSSGASYNQDDLTAASTVFPLGTELLVTNLSNGRSVRVLVNDHGPFVNGRVLDLSYRAALALGIVKPGTARVQMEVLS